MDYDLHITFMDEDMGSAPIHLDQSGAYTLGDACYTLADAVGHEGHWEIMRDIFIDLHGTGPHGAMNADAATSGAFNGVKWRIEETKDAFEDTSQPAALEVIDSALLQLLGE